MNVSGMLKSGVFISAMSSEGMLEPPKEKSLNGSLPLVLGVNRSALVFLKRDDVSGDFISDRNELEISVMKSGIELSWLLRYVVQVGDKVGGCTFNIF